MMMSFISIFNDVIGPVMRGPSSSHTAGSYNIGKMTRFLLNESAVSAVITFDPNGSYAKIYKEQGADLAFAAGLMEWSMTDERFTQSLSYASRANMDIQFLTSSFPEADHPNSVHIQARGKTGKSIHAVAKSTGGGGFVLTKLEDWPIVLDGKMYSLLVESKKKEYNETILKMLPKDYLEVAPLYHEGKKHWLHSFYGSIAFHTGLLSEILSRHETYKVWTTSPLFHPKRGTSLFNSSEEMVSKAMKNECSLGDICLAYESQILGLNSDETLQQMAERFSIMRSSIEWGLQDNNINMKLLYPSAFSIMKAEKAGKLVVGGIHTKAAAYALAVMHTCNSHGVVCAAPTGGSAGVLPGVLSALQEEKLFGSREIALSLFAAGGIGLIISERATFAAEIAGCQVEIGAAGAMAAAAVVELAGGTAQQASDAAAISLQNSMGSVCDLVQGICEIPCHTRNAAAASNALICAEIVLGGYKNPIPLDETIEAVLEVGKAMPCELRVTALGGLAQTPSALHLKKKQ